MVKPIDNIKSFDWHWAGIILKWKMGYRGKPCVQCGFSEAAHYDHDLEFDVDVYPCRSYLAPGSKLDAASVEAVQREPKCEH